MLVPPRNFVVTSHRWWSVDSVESLVRQVAALFVHFFPTGLGCVSTVVDGTGVCPPLSTVYPPDIQGVCSRPCGKGAERLDVTGSSSSERSTSGLPRNRCPFPRPSTALEKRGLDGCSKVSSAIVLVRGSKYLMRVGAPGRIRTCAFASGGRHGIPPCRASELPQQGQGGLPGRRFGAHSARDSDSRGCRCRRISDCYQRQRGRGFPSRGRSPIGPGRQRQAPSTACRRRPGLIASGA
jgi:hypothetical protein